MRVSDVAYEKIKMMIITARLRPGQTLVEKSLICKDFLLSFLEFFCFFFLSNICLYLKENPPLARYNR